MGKMYDVEENENFMISTDELSFFAMRIVKIICTINGICAKI
ncbi:MULTISPECIES: hypothetical protein [unclassified Campylobacter]|nr:MULTISPECIES: hypothetical protein [unclassified Campylobacter]MDA3062384.1 hypothetical protein [Campylobacter sp. JMF_14 EL1]MDA3073497.1 hypothetical protein [Campylobacter sp. JMF_10 EL2]MDA3077497.1 hypothetical protein [Campylobacter sp. JMF_06 NA1]